VRATLISSRVQLVTAIRGHLRANGVHLKPIRTEDFVGLLEAQRLPTAVEELLAPLAKQLSALELSIAMAERRVEELVAREPVTQLLQTAPGVGPIVAAAVVCVIDDPKRFKRAHQVESYVGLVPSENTSGKRRLGAISKQGNPQLRALLLQSAWSLLRKRGEEPLKEWGKQVQARRGKGVGAVAVARRLLGIVWAMWRDDVAYDAERLGRQSAQGISREAQRASFRAQAIAQAGRKASRRRKWVEKILQREALQKAP